MTTHQDTNMRCLVFHTDGHGQCVICACGAHVRPHRWREHIGAAVEFLAAKREAEAAVIEAAKVAEMTLTSMAHAEALYGGQLPDQVLDLLDAIKKLRTLEGDA